MLEPVISLSLETLWVQKCNQATERGSTYARISTENFITFKKRNLYPNTKEPACETLLVLSFIRISNSTDLPERTILESSKLDSLYRSTTLNTTSTILAKKEASVLRKPPTPSPRRIHHFPQRYTQLASPYRCYIEILAYNRPSHASSSSKVRYQTYISQFQSPTQAS